MVRLVAGDGETILRAAVVVVICLSATVVACSLLAIAVGLVWTNRRGRRQGFHTPYPGSAGNDRTPPFSRGCKASADDGQRRCGFDSRLPHSGTPAASPPLAGTPQGSLAQGWPPVATLFDHSTRATRVLERNNLRRVSHDKAWPTGGARRGVFP
ncbi:MAG: hypothetical protein WC683_07780 [bacterium]